MVRNAGTRTLGRMETYQIDPTTCLPTRKSEVTDFHSQSHEFFLWHDPANTNRVLVYLTNWTGGAPTGPPLGGGPSRAHFGMRSSATCARCASGDCG